MVASVEVNCTVFYKIQMITVYHSVLVQEDSATKFLQSIRSHHLSAGTEAVQMVPL